MPQKKNTHIYTLPLYHWLKNKNQFTKREITNIKKYATQLYFHGNKFYKSKEVLMGVNWP